jgi:hypothetical protein
MRVSRLRKAMASARPACGVRRARRQVRVASLTTRMAATAADCLVGFAFPICVGVFVIALAIQMYASFAFFWRVFAAAASGAGPCPAGYYCEAGADRQSCSPGAFCPLNSTAPQLCTPGSYCITGGLAAPSGTCLAGYYCPAGSVQPTENVCTAGSSCKAGSFDPNGDGSCPAGHYCPVGSSSPTQGTCAAGYYCTVGSVLSTGTGQCNVGSFCPAGSSSDKGNGTCTPGYYCPTGSSSATQIICPAGSYCVAGLASLPPPLCAVGAFCLAGASTPLGNGTCEAGFFCPQGSSSARQVLCPAGSYCELGLAQVRHCGQSNCGQVFVADCLQLPESDSVTCLMMCPILSFANVITCSWCALHLFLFLFKVNNPPFRA